MRGTKKDAQRVAAELTVRPVPRAAGRTVADALEQWIETNEDGWAPSTRREQRSRAAAIGDDPLAKVALSRLSVADVERWHARMRRAGAGASAIRNRHTVLRAALAQAVRRGWLTTNPVAGARRAELAGLRWDDFDGERLTIDSAITTIRHGTAADRAVPTLFDAATKTANRRTLTLDPDTVRMIEEQRAERARYGPWMFALGERPPNPDRIGAWWRRARRLAGIDPAWCLHDLRHWSATVAITSGHDVRTVAGRLGHANPAMTLKVYAHAVRAADEAVAKTLGRMLEPGTR